MIPLLLALTLVFSFVPTAAAAGSADSCIQQMINYYRNYPDECGVDLARLNAALAETDPDRAEAWEKIMDYWAWLNAEMDPQADTLPEGLPEDDSLAIVVMGFELNKDGTIRQELVGRLETALRAAQQYPNAYILCTGGATARNNRYATEAGQMAAWLKEQGIDETRIIVENQSISTVQNAQFSCKILSSEYPQVQQLVMVTSDYHLARSSLLFYAQAVLSAWESGTEPLDIVGNLGYQAGYTGSETLTAQATDLSTLIGLPLDRSKPTLSKLTHLAVSGETVFPAGQELMLTVNAYYDSGYVKDVSTAVKYYGLDLAQAGTQTVTIKYTENGVTYSATADIELLSAATEPTIEPIAEPTAEPLAVSELPTEPGTKSPLLPVTVLLLLGFGCITAVRKLRKRKP